MNESELMYSELVEIALAAILKCDCAICNDVISLTYSVGGYECWRLECRSGCPPYAEGVTIQRVVNEWNLRRIERKRK
jgi:hypothetical protein